MIRNCVRCSILHVNNNNNNIVIFFLLLFIRWLFHSKMLPNMNFWRLFVCSRHRRRLVFFFSCSFIYSLPKTLSQIIFALALCVCVCFSFYPIGIATFFLICFCHHQFREWKLLLLFLSARVKRIRVSSLHENIQFLSTHITCNVPWHI